MSHDSSYRGSYSTAFQLAMQRILRLQARSANDPTLVSPHVTSDIYRSGAEFHRGIDFNYVGGQLASNPQTLNVAGQRPVYAPVTGTVVALLPDFGGVIIQNDTDGTFHRILHLDVTAVSDQPPNNRVVAGETQIGTMGGRGPSGPTQFDVHVHYDIFLDAGPAGYQGVVNGVDIDNRIDPIVYWTPGVNPNASLDAQGNPTGTGLLVYAVPVNDVNSNGVIDSPDGPGAVSESGAFVREGESSILKVGINTPHTQSVTLKLTFNTWVEGLNVLALDGVIVTPDPNTSTVYYITLPAAVNQSQPNTSGHVQLYLGEDADSASQTVRYTVEAGYMNSGSFTAYAPSLFTPVTDRSLFILDNDTPLAPGDILDPPPYDPDTQWLTNGTDQNNNTSIAGVGPGHPDFIDFDGDGTNDNRAIQGTANADRIHGNEGDDDIFGHDGGDFLYGDAGENVGHLLPLAA